jgi:hypothetical protein
MLQNGKADALLFGWFRASHAVEGFEHIFGELLLTQRQLRRCLKVSPRTEKNKRSRVSRCKLLK